MLYLLSTLAHEIPNLVAIILQSKILDDTHSTVISESYIAGKSKFLIVHSCPPLKEGPFT